jgi:hypothetical protein
MITQIGINKTGGFLAIDGFLEVTMQEGVFDIHLIDGPSEGGGKSKHHLNCCRLNNRTKGFSIIHFGLLSKSPDDPLKIHPD